MKWNKSLLHESVSLITGEDSCNGDSGGPLVFRYGTDEPWEQVGVVSSGSSVCGVGEPAVYTKVEAYLPWIESKLVPWLKNLL